MAQKSGKTTKIDLYKFISPKGQVKDDSEGAAAGYALGSKTVQGVNSLGNTLNGIAVVVTEIRDALKSNAIAQEKMLQGMVPKRKDDNKTPVKKKKGSGISDFVLPVVAGFFESLAKLAGFLFKTLVARGILKWLSDPKNLEKIETIWNGIKMVAEFLYNFFSSAIFNTLDGIAKMWDPEASWWEKLLGFGQFFVGLGTLLLGLRWLKNPMKLVNDFIWVLKTLWTNLTNSKRKMKKGKWGRILGAVTTVAAVTTAGVVTYQAVKAMPEGSTPNPSPTPENDKNTKPGGGVSLNSEYVILAAGTNDWNDPKVGARGVADAIASIKEMGYKPVFIPPSKEDRYQPVHFATTKAAKDAGAVIEYGQYDPKDPLHPYTHILPSSMKSIQEKYNGAAVIGDSNAENAQSPRFPHRGKSATVVAGAIKSKLKPRSKDGMGPAKQDVPERAAGGWISGPQSGYPVSLTGRGVDFIGHGTEYVAPKKAGGGFVVPFNTPATKNNPGLTGRRMREASMKGFDLGGMFSGFSNGGIYNIGDSLLSGLKGYASGGAISDIQQKALNVLAKYESGAHGYEAVNQIGTNAGRGVKGFSGSFKSMKQHGGRSLTDLTIGEIKQLQYDDRTMSDSQWIAAGKLHAVGRYQFIGNTLGGVAQRAGIPDTAKFGPGVQDLMALQLMKERGISPWVGPSDKATQAERAIVAQARKQNLKIDLNNLPQGTAVAAVPGDGASPMPIGDISSAAQAALDPEQQAANAKKLAFDQLAKSINETRGVLGYTTEAVEEKDKAVETVKQEEESKVVAATKVATAASQQSAATPPPPPPPPQTITIPDLEIPKYLAYLPKLGLFGGAS